MKVLKVLCGDGLIIFSFPFVGRVRSVFFSGERLIVCSPPPCGEGLGEGVLKKTLTPISRKLRSDPTEAEKHLWHVLRYKSFGVKFRRQAVIGRYIVDFVCYEKKLVIEVDGGQHCLNQSDILRDEWLRSQGFEVLRFWNNDVLGNLDGVCEVIEERVNTPSLGPSPQGGGKADDGRPPQGGDPIARLVLGRRKSI